MGQGADDAQRGTVGASIPGAVVDESRDAQIDPGRAIFRVCWHLGQVISQQIQGADQIGGGHRVQSRGLQCAGDTAEQGAGCTDAQFGRGREQRGSVPNYGRRSGFGVKHFEAVSRFAVDYGGAGAGGRGGWGGEHQNVRQFGRHQARAHRRLAGRIFGGVVVECAPLGQHNDDGPCGDHRTAAAHCNYNVGLGLLGHLHSEQN